MNAKAVTALTQAKSLIDTPEKWGKKAFALQGKLCLMEALIRSCGKDSKLCGECITLLKEVWGDVPHIKILTSYNDTHTHEEVMKLFDDAILLASAPDKVEPK
jgi:hypothetical protein